MVRCTTAGFNPHTLTAVEFVSAVEAVDRAVALTRLRDALAVGASELAGATRVDRCKRHDRDVITAVSSRQSCTMIRTATVSDRHVMTS